MPQKTAVRTLVILGAIALAVVLGGTIYVAYLIVTMEPDTSNAASLTVTRLEGPPFQQRVLNLTEEDVGRFPARVREAFLTAADTGTAHVVIMGDERVAWHASLVPVEKAQGGPSQFYALRGAILRADEVHP